DKAQREGRGVSAWEQAKIFPMITQSDNDAATALWNYVGPYNAIAAMQSHGMASTVISPESPSYWGYTRTTARDMLTIVSHIRWRQLWSGDKHDYALSVM